MLNTFLMYLWRLARKLLANSSWFAKFANFFQCQNFPVYSTIKFMHVVNVVTHSYVVTYMTSYCHSHTGFLNQCNKCTHPVSRPSCEYCKCLSLSCSVCHVSVKGEPVTSVINSKSRCTYGNTKLYSNQIFIISSVCLHACMCVYVFVRACVRACMCACMHMCVCNYIATIAKIFKK